MQDGSAKELSVVYEMLCAIRVCASSGSYILANADGSEADCAATGRREVGAP